MISFSHSHISVNNVLIILIVDSVLYFGVTSLLLLFLSELGHSLRIFIYSVVFDWFLFKTMVITIGIAKLNIYSSYLILYDNQYSLLWKLIVFALNNHWNTFRAWPCYWVGYVTEDLYTRNQSLKADYINIYFFTYLY